MALHRVTDMEMIFMRKGLGRVARRHQWCYYIIEIVASMPGLTSKQLAHELGIDYLNNFNKREAKYARRLALWIVRAKEQNIYRWRVRPEFRHLNGHQIKKLFREREDAVK